MPLIFWGILIAHCVIILAIGVIATFHEERWHKRYGSQKKTEVDVTDVRRPMLVVTVVSWILVVSFGPNFISSTADVSLMFTFGVCGIIGAVISTLLINPVTRLIGKYRKFEVVDTGGPDLYGS
jgi:hypothetical protein